MGDVFSALGDPSRRTLLDNLNAHGAQSLTELCAGMAMTRQSVSKHLGVLEEANLVATVRRGREKLHYLNPAPINDIAGPWIARYDQQHAGALSDLRRALEDRLSTSPEFVYVSYIRASPERLYGALTESESTRRYWGIEFETSWQPGAPMTWRKGPATLSDPRQVVLEADPYRRLAYTWHAFSTEGNAHTGELDEARLAIARGEALSRVSFELEPRGELVKLTVLHDSFGPGSILRTVVSRAWPVVVSRLKSMLETGRAGPAID
jgi:DNA-binding transcriptional ArsR family regulator/uncharacterized protein YndB with AHSA1/START domain